MKTYNIALTYLTTWIDYHDNTNNNYYIFLSNYGITYIKETDLIKICAELNKLTSEVMVDILNGDGLSSIEQFKLKVPKKFLKEINLYYIVPETQFTKRGYADGKLEQLSNDQIRKIKIYQDKFVDYIDEYNYRRKIQREYDANSQI